VRCPVSRHRLRNPRVQTAETAPPGESEFRSLFLRVAPPGTFTTAATANHIAGLQIVLEAAQGSLKTPRQRVFGQPWVTSTAVNRPAKRWDTTRGCGAGNREQSFTCYSGFVDQTAHPVRPSQTDRIVSPSFEELAARQGVTPIDDFETLLGEPSPEDESAEEFSASLREWRREGTRPANPQ